MKHRKLTNVAASVRQRLLNQARATDRPFNELLQYFAMERFLFRLSRSPHAGKFILKGALMLTQWEVSHTRPTRDIDLLGRTSNDIGAIESAIKEVCLQEAEPDGLIFDPTSVTGDRIAEDAEYEGVRIRFRGNLGTARISMQIDVGFGDAVVPCPVLAEFPTILNLPAPRIRGYTRESMVAEKLHAMIQRGLLNSRIRDFFDLWALSRQFDFLGETLTSAIRETFTRRNLDVEPRPVALTEEFARDTSKAAQWRGFLRKNRLVGVPGDLSEVIEAIAMFLGPVTEALSAGDEFQGQWNAPGPWSR